MASSENTTSSDDSASAWATAAPYSLEVGVERAHRQVELGGRQAHGAMISDTQTVTGFAVLAVALALTTTGLARPAAERAPGSRRGAGARRDEVR